MFMLALCDEASRMREESWHAVRSTLTFTQVDQIRIIGNVRGRKNWFYRHQLRMAEEGADDMARSIGSQPGMLSRRVFWTKQRLSLPAVTSLVSARK